MTYTSDRVHNILRTGFDRSPMFQGIIHGVGPRYCPSIEDKINRFADKDRHQIFVEPEGRYTNEMYLSGLSSSLPEDVQIALLHTMPGFQKAEMVRHAYATGSAPAQLVAAIAMKFRAMTKVSASSGRKNLGMSPWQAERARRELRAWPDPALASAITAIAQADEDTKGASKDPQGAVEKLVMTLCRLHRG